MTRSGRLALFLSLMIVTTAALRAPAASQTPGAPGTDEFAAVMERLSLKIPASVSGSDPVRKPLGELNRERCDQQAIADLGKALESAGYRREASTALMRYSETCG